MRIVTSNEIWLANGTDGLSGIPGPWRADLGPHGFNLFYLGIVVAVVAVAFFIAERLCYSPFGRVLRAIRDDEQVASVAGKYVLAFKLKAFAIGTGALGLAGALYAHFTSYIAPDVFVPLLTLYIKLSLLAGGLGNNRGALLGAVAVVFFLESTRFIVPLIPWLTHVQGAALREILISVTLLVILRYHTKGLIPGTCDASRAAGRTIARPRRTIPNWSHDMSQSLRALTVEDIAGVFSLSAAAADPMQVYAKIDALVRETVGYKFLTVLRFVEETQEVERLYSSDTQGLSSRRPQAAQDHQQGPQSGRQRRNLPRRQRGRGEKHLPRPRADLQPRRRRHPQRPDPPCWPPSRHAELLRRCQQLRRPSRSKPRKFLQISLCPPS